MRNGQTVSTGLVAEFSPAEIVRQMIGDPVLAEAAFARSGETVQLAARQKQILVQANGISRRGVLKRIDLTLHVGEIVGLWGLLGSGRTELARALLGLDAIDSGDLFLRNVSSGVLESVSPAKLRDATGFVTEDRRGEGLFLPLSVAENISLPSLARLLGRAGLIDRKRERSFSAEKVNALKVTGRLTLRATRWYPLRGQPTEGSSSSLVGDRTATFCWMSQLAGWMCLPRQNLEFGQRAGACREICSADLLRD
jgi:ABC-type sugar transport system ATPase subunit